VVLISLVYRASRTVQRSACGVLYLHVSSAGAVSGVAIPPPVLASGPCRWATKLQALSELRGALWLPPVRVSAIQRAVDVAVGVGVIVAASRCL
jgi:hypothetical protein